MFLRNSTQICIGIPLRLWLNTKLFMCVGKIHEVMQKTTARMEKLSTIAKTHTRKEDVKISTYKKGKTPLNS